MTTLTSPILDPAALEHMAAGTVNHDNLHYAYSQCQDIGNFLTDPNLRVPLHASRISDPAENLKLSFDLDGVFCELESIKAIKSGLHFLFLSPRISRTLENHYVIVRKHVDTTLYSTKGWASLQHCCGLVIGHVDPGYFLNLTAFPKDPQNPDPGLFTKEGFLRVAKEALQEVGVHFQESLAHLSPQDLRRPTIVKQCLTRTSKFEVLAQDLSFILDLVDRAITHTNFTDNRVNLVASLTRFGQKQDSVGYFGFLDRSAIRAMSVHVACNIAAKDSNVHLLWARSGIKHMFGAGSREFTSLGLHECVNVQTTLDGRRVTLERGLLKVLPRNPLRFVQVYTDTVHCRFSPRHYHPVSGAVVLCQLQHPQSAASIYATATEYLERVADCAQKMVGQLQARLECVVYLDKPLPYVLVPENLIDHAELEDLLAAQSLLVPFVDGACSLVGVLKESLQHIYDGLNGTYSEHHGVGGFEASWRAFQFELAFEELIFGHPLCPTDRPYSASLGTCSVHEWSLTHQRGFLGLAPINSAAVGTDPPELRKWTLNRQLQARVRRFFPLTDCFEAAPAVVGEALVRIVLGDLYADVVGGIPYALLKGNELPDGCQVLGGQSYEDLANLIATKAYFGFPHTFNRAKQLATAKNLDLCECLVQGVQELSLRYFPAIRLTDANKNRAARRVPNSFVLLHDSSTNPPREAVLASLVQKVCEEVERRGLSYARNLDRFKAYGMPWLNTCDRRLPASLSENQRLMQLTFLSCIGLRMNGEFVAYEAWRRLTEELTLPQDQMQRLLIQSRELLESLTMFRVYKLHKSVPYRLFRTLPSVGPRPPTTTPPKEPEQEQELVTEDSSVVDVPELKSHSKVMPHSLSRVPWSPMELSLVCLDKQLTHRGAYALYIQSCQDRKMGVRTFSAYTQKRRVMMAGM